MPESTIIESILLSVKKMIGIESEQSHFDADLIMHINSVFMILNQLGIGPDSGFRITGSEEEWSDYIDDQEKLDAVKSYMYLKVRSLFDPPQQNSVKEAINENLKELEWRLNLQVERLD